jgi:DeoR family deoxyribose operon repressor
MNKEARQQAIIELLQDADFASVKDLADRFTVSQMTIRRDLETLERSELIRVIHGGAVFNRDHEDGAATHEAEYSFQLQRRANWEQKLRIGNRAAELVEPNDVIIVDSGTTAEAFVRAISPDTPITVVCYAANIFDVARYRPNWRVILAGGHFHTGDLMFESSEGLSLVDNTRANKAFIAAGGISERLGLTCVNRYETETKRAAIRSSLSTILLADSSKFGQVTPSHFADLEDVDTVITDAGIGAEFRSMLVNAEIRLLVAGPTESGFRGSES